MQQTCRHLRKQYGIHAGSDQSFGLEHNKAQSIGPGLLLTQQWCPPKGVRRSCAVG